MKEEDIRPDALFARYRELSAQDAHTCFRDLHRTAIGCVACGGTDTQRAFEKSGFEYARCAACGSLFQSPRPAIEAFERFYRDSESSRYWAEVFFPAVAEARRERIFRPRVERLADMCAAQQHAVDRLIEVGAGYGIFLDEWRRRFGAAQAIAIEPSESLADECRAKGFEVVEDIVENVSEYRDYADLVVCFEVLEHVHEPLAFVAALTGLARPGGYVCISALGIDGFDIQVLWEKSNSIFPPYHINFLSVEGFEHLFTRAGLRDVRVTTPGQLDVDIVRNALRRDPHLLEGQRFLQRLLADTQRAAAFQRFLSENQLSSHTWVMARRPSSPPGADD